MPKNRSIVRYSVGQLAALKSHTDWAKADAVSREEIERVASLEDGDLPDGWEQTISIGEPSMEREKADRPVPVTAA